MIKNILIAITIAAASMGAFAQDKLGIRPYHWHPKGASAQSVDVSVNQESVGVLWLRDGLSANYTAISYPVFQVLGLQNRVNIVALGSFDSNFTHSNMYLGTGVSVDVFKTNGFKVALLGGLKGFNLGHNLEFSKGRSGWVWGLSVTIPVK